MQASAARIQANRLNAQRSTGPNTEAGKAASRANSYKHGLTGSGVVIGPGDVDEVARVESALVEEMRPSGELGRILVGRVAILAVRLDRCAVQESAAIAERVRRAEADHDDRLADEADALFDRLADDPSPGHLIRKLRRTPEGIARLIRGWLDLVPALRQPDPAAWTPDHVRAFEALIGHRAADLSPSRPAALSRLMLVDDLAGLPTADLAGLPDRPSRQAWARDRLVARIADEIDDLEAAQADLDHAGLGLDRAGAPARALFDPSREATLARKYEAAAERNLYRALREFDAAEAQAAAALEPPSDPATTRARGTLASFFPAPSAAPARRQPEPHPARPADHRPEPAIIPHAGAAIDPGGR